MKLTEKEKSLLKYVFNVSINELEYDGYLDEVEEIKLLFKKLLAKDTNS
jgi:hypothetical protein